MSSGCVFEAKIRGLGWQEEYNGDALEPWLKRPFRPRSRSGFLSNGDQQAQHIEQRKRMDLIGMLLQRCCDWLVHIGATR
jgi:hypothetical protein